MAGASVLGGAMKGADPAFARSENATDAVFDNSGWTVNFGDGATQNAERSQLPQIGGGINTTVIIIVVAGLIAWKMYTKSKR